MATDALVMQGARASATMILTMLKRDNLVPKHFGLTGTWAITCWSYDCPCTSEIKLADLFTLNVLKMYYKFKHACLPSHVENMFEEFSRNHEHETRQSLILEEPMVNTASGENCLRYILPRIINKTNPTIIKIIDSHSFVGFVRYLKNYMIIHYVDYCVIPNCYICNHMNP